MNTILLSFCLGCNDFNVSVTLTALAECKATKLWQITTKAQGQGLAACLTSLPNKKGKYITINISWFPQTSTSRGHQYVTNSLLLFINGEKQTASTVYVHVLHHICYIYIWGKNKIPVSSVCPCSLESVWRASSIPWTSSHSWRSWGKLRNLGKKTKLHKIWHAFPTSYFSNGNTTIDLYKYTCILIIITINIKKYVTFLCIYALLDLGMRHWRAQV